MLLKQILANCRFYFEVEMDERRDSNFWKYPQTITLPPYFNHIFRAVRIQHSPVQHPCMLLLIKSNWNYFHMRKTSFPRFPSLQHWSFAKAILAAIFLLLTAYWLCQLEKYRLLSQIGPSSTFFCYALFSLSVIFRGRLFSLLTFSYRYLRALNSTDTP